jgi:DNA replication protein DnaC
MKSVGETLHAIRERYKDKPMPQGVPLPPPACSDCRDLGWYTLDVELSDPEFGKVVSCGCRTEGWKTTQQEKLRTFANVPERFKGSRFEDTAWDPPQFSAEQRKRFVRCAEFCRKYALSQTAETWLVMAGSKGWGKTHLACCIVNKRVERNESAKFIGFPALLDELKSGFDDNSYQETLTFYQGVELLILDDLGAQRETEWSEEQLYKIIDHRYANNLKTVITTNVQRSQIDSRVVDRMEDSQSAAVFMENLPSYRTGKERA